MLIIVRQPCLFALQKQGGKSSPHQKVRKNKEDVMRYKISELAKLLGVSTNTVRRYEDMGYISAVRDENSGYRYYNDDDIFSVMNAKMHVKYGFSHEQISQMQSFSLEETIDAYKKRMDEMDKQITYMTYLRHRLKDDYLLMNKAATYSDIYEKMSLTMYTVIYKDGEKLLQEPERLQKLGEFIYNSPEVLHTYIIPKESVDNGNFRVCCGWSVKEEHMDKYGMTENSYTQIYKGKPSVMGISEVPADIGRLANENPEYLKELMIGKHLDYMKEHNLYLNGDIIGIVITKVRDSGKNVIYMLMSLPFGKNDV